MPQTPVGDPFPPHPHGNATSSQQLQGAGRRLRLLASVDRATWDPVDKNTVEKNTPKKIMSQRKNASPSPDNLGDQEAGPSVQEPGLTCGRPQATHSARKHETLGESGVASIYSEGSSVTRESGVGLCPCPVFTRTWARAPGQGGGGATPRRPSDVGGAAGSALVSVPEMDPDCRAVAGGWQEIMFLEVRPQRKTSFFFFFWIFICIYFFI